MSKIEKLSILGVRSFDPVNRETIQFHTPLTLIVGYNGSGKTTIIECLKYATTGELPPNSKGGAFIHDPTLCGEKEVLAQVKLSFRSTVGELCVVTRSLQLTIKKTTRSQKTLEGTLTWRSNGERTSVSSRVNDLDTLIPEKLGVSQAILDAVIFTHQDESLWPMSEPSVLKKRFDEIFEAMRYTKAIDNLKVLRKKYGEKLKLLAANEKIDKETKNRAETKKRDMTELDREIDELRGEIEELTTEMEDTQEKSREKAEQANASLRYVQDLKHKQDQLEFRQRTVQELRETIEEMSEGDEFLQEALAQYEDRVARLQAEADQSVAQWKALQEQLASNRKSLAAKLSEQGKHQSDKDKFEQQSEVLARMVRDAAQRHEIRGYDGDLSDLEVQDFFNRLNKVLQDKRKELLRIQQENGWELDTLGSEMQALEGRKIACAQDRSSAKGRIELIDKDVARRNTVISSLDIDEGSSVIQATRLEDLDRRLAIAQVEATNGDAERELQVENSNLTRLEAENDQLGRELVDCTRLAGERAQLEVRKKELTDRKRELETRVNTWTEKISGVVGAGWTPATVETAFQDALKRQQRAVDDANSIRDAAQAEMKQVEFRLTAAREKRSKAASEESQGRMAVKHALESVGKPTPIDEYPAEVEELESQLVVAEQDLKLFDYLKEYYEKCQKVLDNKNLCELCTRPFSASEASQKAKLASRILKRIDAETKREAEEDKAVAERKLKVLRAVRSQYDTYYRARQELPSLDKEIRALETEREGLLRRLEQHDAVCKEAHDKQQEIETLGKTIARISQLAKDVGDSETEIERSVAQLSQTGSIRGAEEIHAQQTATAEQIKVTKDKVKKMEADKRRKQDVLNALALEQSELKNRVGQANQQLARKRELLEEIQQLRSEYARHREAIQQADRDMESLELELAKARAIRDDAVQRGRANEAKAAEERDALSETVNQLKLTDSDIKRYIESGGPANLEANAQAIRSFEQSISTIERDIQEATVQANKMKQEIANSDRQKKNISDNLNLRKNVQELRDLQLEIHVLQQRNDQADYDRIMREKNALDSHHNKLLAKRGTKMGEASSKDKQLEHLLAEWKQEYEGAADKYKASLVMLEGTKAAIGDLGKYSAALDQAVMQYHSLKMAEVNRIAGELWQSTYQGTDIDTILIRSDADTDGSSAKSAAASASGRRSYNYRVCMVKQDTEMDMRGRCSAGQKVLASIIIRLALAESFGINCGLIALDEPTTNLDSDNIRSLAESLHRIIRARQAQSNFQLIVITHDEEFLRHMQCSDFCDTFYRVRRDEKQCSIIRGESITKVME